MPTIENDTYQSNAFLILKRALKKQDPAHADRYSKCALFDTALEVLKDSQKTWHLWHMRNYYRAQAGRTQRIRRLVFNRLCGRSVATKAKSKNKGTGCVQFLLFNRMQNVIILRSVGHNVRCNRCVFYSRSVVQSTNSATYNSNSWLNKRKEA